MLAWPVPVSRTARTSDRGSCCRHRRYLKRGANRGRADAPPTPRYPATQACQTSARTSEWKDPNVAGNEPVLSPDQLKPTNRRKARIGAVSAIVILLLMTIGNHKGNTENYFMYGLAGLIVVVLVGDWVLRRNGLRD
ncbi:DUF2631 domain-containing protein [Planosporangium flavigriseum]|nr:DUF2631 domain-containing protein [Planosporangium flavigriseum]